MRAVASVAAVIVASAAATTQPALHVLRTAPGDPAEPTAQVAVTFDRPVAGQLDGTVDPATIFAIAPAAAGKVEWRDPITLVFTPSAPLTARTRYTVTVANTFKSMDGAALEAPYQFSFRVGGPRVLAASPVGPGHSPSWLRGDVQFKVLLSMPVELGEVGQFAHLELARSCAGATVVRLTGVAQRAVRDDDPPDFRQAGDWRRDRRFDAFRRVVTLAPSRPVPQACSGDLVIQPMFDPASTDRPSRWSFATYGPLRIAGAVCDNDPMCPAGFARISFTTPVKGADVLRAVHLAPATRFTLDDTSASYPAWSLQAPLRTRTQYTIRVDSDLTDVFGQRITGPLTATLSTTGYPPGLDYESGTMLVERSSFRTLAVRHVNVDTLLVTTAAVPESLEARILAAPRWNVGDAWSLVASGAATRAVPVPGAADVPLVSAVKIPTYNAMRPGAPTLTLFKVERRGGDSAEARRRRTAGGTALVQVTDLGIAARLGAEEALVWVTTLHDGRAAAGVAVTVYGPTGQVRARATTDSAGVARITGLAPLPQPAQGASRGFVGYAAATLGSDRALVSFDDYSWELSPWRFNVSASTDEDRLPAAAAVFTERGIYRPGEDVHAKAIVRTGNLGALHPPQAGDSLRWVFHDRENGTLRDTAMALSAFGTADQAFHIGADAPLGTYRVELELRRGGSWIAIASTYYRVAEYRPPEFLVSLSSDTAPHGAGDTLVTGVEARYLFGAPMGRAAVAWTARRSRAWWFEIPGLADYEYGESGWWWEDEDEPSSESAEVIAGSTDTLDATGRLAIRVPLAAPPRGRAARVVVQATVTDVNRQTVTATTSAMIHPAAIYVAAKSLGDAYFWRSGRAESIAVLTVRPDGRRVSGIAVHGVLVRREWHRVMRQRDGYDEQVGDWVSDTVAQCDVTTAAAPVPCRFTPPQGGSYVVTFRARDDAGRAAVTTFYRWATGRGWVPWGDANQFKMDVIPDKTRYNVGDTATVLFASPFTDAEALVTIEREGVIEYRRMRITAGATSMKLPLTEIHVPNVFVSIVVVRGRSAPPGGIADAGRPALRVGYAELKVTPAIKRLDVAVHPESDQYRPGDTARIDLTVRDVHGDGQRSEVTLWAVDEGVLSLTGYRTPDPVDLLYQPRGVGLKLASNLVDIAAQVLDSEGVSIKGEHAPGGGGGLETGDVLRSRFQTTAFFIGSVVTDSAGRAVVAARLPDNLTTFRVMAVAVTRGDRYGKGESPMLVTRPLLARPALPRFLRRDDRVVAGVVVNQRAGGTPTVRVRAAVRGVLLTGPAAKTATLAAGRGTEVRFAFRDTAADQATLRFDVSSDADSDAVLARLPVRPPQTPRAHTTAGMVTLTSPVSLNLPGDIDPDHSQLIFSIGTTPLALINGMARDLAVYPYDCSEQVTDAMLPLIALLRYGGAAGIRTAPAGARRQVEEGVLTLTRRQRADGGIGLWDAQSWTTPWLSSYAGQALLDARALGIPVGDSVLARLADYLYRSVHQRKPIQAPLQWWFQDQRAAWSEDVAAVDFLSRFGRPDMAGENELLRVAPQLYWEDRVRLAEMVARRGAGAAAARLLAPIWQSTRIEGRRAVIADSAARQRFYFWSEERPAALLLSATLAVDSASPLIGPLVETVIESARSDYWWNTQDYGAAVQALADFAARQQRAARRGFAVAGGGRILFRSDGTGDPLRQFTSNLAGLLGPDSGGTRRLGLTVTAPAAGGSTPLYYYVTVLETPRTRAVNPDEQGIAVERWYEDYATGRPTVSVPEGSLVRVRLRIRITAERRFLVLSDPLPAGLEAVDLSLMTSGLPGPGVVRQPFGQADEEGEQEEPDQGASPYPYDWYYGMWDGGWWSPFDHRDMRDDRVDYVATYLWPGTYTATYVARATTPGVFVRPPAHAEEMYNPAVQGRSDGGEFTVTPRQP